MMNGRRSVAQNSVPWTMDSDIVLDGKPSEQFPVSSMNRQLWLLLSDSAKTSGSAL